MWWCLQRPTFLGLSSTEVAGLLYKVREPKWPPFSRRHIQIHFLNKWWLVYWHIYASLGLHELTPQVPGDFARSRRTFYLIHKSHARWLIDKGSLFNHSVITVAAAGLEPWVARTSAVTVMSTSKCRIYTEPAFNRLIVNISPLRSPRNYVICTVKLWCINVKKMLTTYCVDCVCVNLCKVKIMSAVYDLGLFYMYD